jgi:competence protein ComEC
MVLGGVGGKDLAGPQLTTHSLNVVLRIVSGTRGLVLLAGDMDQLALDSLINEKSSAEAKLLVFPHHGGHLGSSNLMEFVQKICGLVSPEIIVFSIGRGKHNTPRPEIIAAVKNRIPSVRIACTQLSEYCAANVPVTEPSHLTSEAARGKVSNSCCSGTLVLEIAENADSLLPLLPDHQAFITTAAPTALCKR